MIASLILFGVGLILLTIFLIDKCHKYSVRATFFKMLVSVCFVGVAVSGWFYSSKENINIFGIFIIMGLLFGLLGDILLDYKYVFREEDVIFTKLGFLVFGIGHIIYITGIFLCFTHFKNLEFIPWYYILIALGIGIVSVVAVILLEKPMKNNYGKFKPICLAYSFILFSMFGVSLCFAWYHEFTNWTLNFMTIGGILFVISDLILSGTYFGVGKERPIDIVTNTVTYYLAQFFIAFSLLMLVF